MPCGACGSRLPANGLNCQRCGTTFGIEGGALASALPDQVATGWLTDRAAGTLAYVTIIPAVIFLVSDEYNKRLSIRFHAFQSIFLASAAGATIGLLLFIPSVGWLLEPVSISAFLVAWMAVVFKAYKGIEFQLPMIGELARKQADQRGESNWSAGARAGS